MRTPSLRSRCPLFLGLLGLVAGGLGCSGLGGSSIGKLPPDPAPWGFPSDQEIEGGMQVRITRPGVDKLTSLIPDLVAPLIGSTQSIGRQSQGFGLADLIECGKNCNGVAGCPLSFSLNRQIAPPGGVQISLRDDPNKALLHIKVAFDVHLPVDVVIDPIIGGATDICGCGDRLFLDAPGTTIDADIRLDIDTTTGKLIMSLDNVNQLQVNLGTSGCGIAGNVLNAFLSILDAIVNSFIGNLVVNAFKPQLTNLIRGFLPDPPGLAGSLNLGSMLASFNAPKDAALELLLVAGGYVSAKGGGLNLGVLAGTNSDRDPGTRSGGLATEPSLCVPRRPAPDLRAGVWKLPSNPIRNDYSLNPANEFSGTPDPLDMNGATQDIAMGVSKSFLNLAGFHLYNSGGLCLAISGGVLSALNIGTVSVLVPSLSNLVENRKAPMAIALRPEQPLVFTLGSGAADDPLLRVAVTDLRVDFYGFLEERFVRIFTLAVDLNVGVNLAITMGQDGKPALQPMVTGLDKMSVMARVQNTDLLQEDPKMLAKSLLGLLDIAVGQLTGAIKPIPLPEIMGFSLTGLSVRRVQTTQDDFLGIFGSILKGNGGMNYPLPPEADGVSLPMGVATTARLIAVDVPPPDVIRAALQADDRRPGSVPSITVELGGNRQAEPLEWSYRVDNAGWSFWSPDARPTIADPAFLLQGRHVFEVRARVRGDFATEDQTPQRFDVVIDSIGPEVEVAARGDGVVATASDNVSDDDAIRFAWSTPDGWSPLSRRTTLTAGEVRAATLQGERPLSVRAVDEEGNVTEIRVPLGSLESFHGRTLSAGAGGCGCRLGERSPGNRALPLAAFALIVAALLRRRR